MFIKYIFVSLLLFTMTLGAAERRQAQTPTQQPMDSSKRRQHMKNICRLCGGLTSAACMYMASHTPEGLHSQNPKIAPFCIGAGLMMCCIGLQDEITLCCCNQVEKKE